jgi:hypothetical protein
MHAKTLIPGLVGLMVVLGLTACSSEPTSAGDGVAQADEQGALAAEPASAEATAATRREKSQATQDAVIEIINDPSAFGTEEEVLHELVANAAPGTLMDDVVFGAVLWRSAWHNTLFGGLDAKIRTWHRWMSEDGSMGGSLWTWSGTNRAGEPFELIGVDLSEYDEEGKTIGALIVWPYPDEVVKSALSG